PLPSEPTVVHRPIDSTVLPQVPSTHPRSLSTGILLQRDKRSLWKSAARYAMIARMEPSPFGVQATVASGELPAEWQAPAAQWQALAAEAERVLTAQAGERR